MDGWKLEDEISFWDGPIFRSYCWWTKSQTTTWDVFEIPKNNGIIIILHWWCRILSINSMVVREGTKTLTFWICSSQSPGGLIHGILKWRGERLAREPHPWVFFGWANVGFGCFGRCLMGLFVGDRSWIGLKQMTIDTLVSTCWWYCWWKKIVAPTWDVIKEPVNNWTNYQPQLASLTDFWTINSMTCTKGTILHFQEGLYINLFMAVVAFVCHGSVLWKFSFQALLGNMFTSSSILNAVSVTSFSPR